MEVIVISTILLYFKVKCPVGCEYCFEKPSDINGYDLNIMMDTLKNIYVKGDTICLHGGEVCTLPLKDLATALKKIRTFLSENEDNQKISLQTSLYGMTNEHIRLFKKYNVGVGVSIDGPPEFNILRGPREKERNNKYQKDLIDNLEKLKKDNVVPGHIAVLTKINASKDNIDILIKWAKETKFDGRFNPMFVPDWNSNMKQYELTVEELKYAWLRLAQECINDKNLKWNPFREFIDNLMGTFYLSPCIVSRCDYLTTTCKTIMGDGTIARCDRCFQEGYYGRGISRNNVRSEVLKSTECDTCKYFEICGGGCPSEGIDGDYRHKSHYCDAYYAVYSFLEDKIRGLMPNIILSVDISNYYNEYDQKGKKLDFFRNFDNGTWRSYPPKKQVENDNDCNCKKNSDRTVRPHGDHYDDNHYNNINEELHGDHYNDR